MTPRRLPLQVHIRSYMRLLLMHGDDDSGSRSSTGSVATADPEVSRCGTDHAHATSRPHDTGRCLRHAGPAMLIAGQVGHGHPLSHGRHCGNCLGWRLPGSTHKQDGDSCSVWMESALTSCCGHVASEPMLPVTAHPRHIWMLCEIESGLLVQAHWTPPATS